jgi:hypothetical protein
MERTFKTITGILVSAGSEGDAAGDIPASLFGLSYIEEVGPLVVSTSDTVILAFPAYDGGSIVIKAAAANEAEALAAGTYRLTVKGY